MSVAHRYEAFFTPDGKEVWVTVRGENYVSVLDSATYNEKTRITVPNGPGMTIFSPSGKYGYVCSSFTPETDVITVADHKVVGKVVQTSPFCPRISRQRRMALKSMVHFERYREDADIQRKTAIRKCLK